MFTQSKYFYSTASSVIVEKRKQSLQGGGKAKQDAQHAKVRKLQPLRSSRYAEPISNHNRES